MSIKKTNKLRLGLITIAVALSVFNGIFSLLTVLVFAEHESAPQWISVILPAFLWLPALACAKFPRAGLLGFVILLGLALMIGVDPFHHQNSGWSPWMRGLEDLRFAVLGALLLLLNLVFLHRFHQQPGAAA